MELFQLTATELSKLLQKKELSALELTQSVYSRIHAVEDRVYAYITLCEQTAVQAAKAVDQARVANQSLHPLAGIPIGIKDNLCTKNLLTTCASKMLYNFVPPYTATAVEKVEQAGMVIVGKLNMDEFAMGSSTETSYYKMTRNPYDLERVPGGSSGGSAAAVAAGEAILSLGTDTGGSIRQPAALCGVVGLKPTYGSVSRYGLIAFASSLDQIGPLARCVDDAALLYSVIRGKDPLDATSESLAPFSWEIAESEDLSALKGLRVGLPAEYFCDAVSQDNQQAVYQAAKMLQQHGAEVVDISLPSTEYALSAYYIISSAEASSNLARFDGVRYGYRAKQYQTLTEMYENTRSEGFGEEVKRRILLGTFVLSSGYYDAYYKRAKLMQRKISHEFRSAFETCDVILSPTVPSTAFKIGQEIEDPVQMHANDLCTASANIAGLPAISVPCGQDAKGLPIGLQLFGNHFSEERLLKVAKCCETLLGRSPMPLLCNEKEDHYAAAV